MSWRVIASAWNKCFFEPQSPAPLGLYRILFGLLVMAKLVLLYPDWLAWFGVHSWVTLDTMRKMESGLRINVFDLLPQSNVWIWAFFWIALACAASLTLGLFTRLTSVLVFFALVSMDERELYMMNSGDTFLRVAAFWMIFAPSEAAFSLDRLLAIWRGKETPQHKPQIVWAQRMLQFQTSLVYFITAWWKSTGATWINGTALYYVHHLEQFKRFPIPAWSLDPTVIRLLTWIGLIEEFALGTLIWIVEARYWVLAAGVVLHLTLEYTMNVPLFQWIMMSTFVLFVRPADLERVWVRATDRLRRPEASRLELVYNAADFRVRRWIDLLRALDIFRNIHFVKENAGTWYVRTPESTWLGRSALGTLAFAIPLLWPIAPFLGTRTERKPVTPEGLTRKQ